VPLTAKNVGYITHATTHQRLAHCDTPL